MAPALENDGYCCCCDSQTRFVAEHEWLRDHYLCTKCRSLPRERALMHCIETMFPRWRSLKIHESSPSDRGASVRLKQLAPGYIGSHFYPDLPLGALHSSGYANQDLEQQTFASESFDLVVTQDVLEHIYNPGRAFAEIARTLKPGGAHVLTVPLVNKERPSEVWARRNPDGSPRFLKEPEYHGNPIDSRGSPVTMHWGYDIGEYIHRTSCLTTTIVSIDRIELGLRAEYNEVLVSRKSRGWVSYDLAVAAVSHARALFARARSSVR